MVSIATEEQRRRRQEAIDRDRARREAQRRSAEQRAERERIIAERQKQAAAPPPKHQDAPGGSIGIADPSYKPKGQEEVDYIVEHAGSKERQELESFISTPPTTIDTRQKEGSIGLADPSIKGRQLLIKGYESLSPSEKEEYGYRFTDWKSMPVEERKYYPGFKTYISKVSPERQESMVLGYLQEQPTKEFVVPAKYPGTMQTLVRHGGGVEPGVPLSYKSIQKYDVGESTKAFRNIALFVWSKGSSLGEISYKTALQNLKDATRLELFYTPVEIQEIKQRQYETKHPLQKVIISFTRAYASAGMYPVTLTQMGVKYVTGEGALTDPLGRISKGKTLLFPDVAKEFQKTSYGAPSGIIVTGIEEGISAWTGQDSDAWERFSRDPLSGISATIGELGGLYVGGKAIHIGKVSTVKALKATGIPSFPLKYRPTMLLRKAYWKGREKLGYAQEISPEIAFKSSALPSGLSYVPGKTPTERIIVTVKAFEKTQVVSKTGEKYLVGIHTTERAWLKPFTYLRKGRESPGVSFAPFGKGTPRFLRITGEPLPYETSGISLFPKIRLPTAPLLYFKQLRKIPSSLKDLSYKITSKFIKHEPGVYIAPKLYKGGGEYEAIARGFAVREGAYYFTQIEGVVVPFPGFKLIEKASVSFGQKVVSKIPSGFKSFVSPFSYTGKVSIPLISPSYLGSVIGRIIPSVPSEPSYPSKPSYPSYPSVYSYLSEPSVPSEPSYPSKPSYPPYPSVYSYLSEPSVPSEPSYPSKPSYPSYPSIPSVPSVPSEPSYPSKPSYPSSPSFPSYPSGPSYPGIPVIPPSVPPFLLLPSSGRAGKTQVKGQAFAPFVKDRVYVKGKKVYDERFIRMGKTPLSEIDAMALGAFLTDESVARSFKVKPIDGEPQPLDMAIPSWNMLMGKFYKKNDRMIEKITHAIDSPGEFEGITAKGILARIERKSKKAKRVQPRSQKVSHIPIHKAREPIDIYDDVMNNMNEAFERMDRNMRIRRI